jgi:hypothetical protein
MKNPDHISESLETIFRVKIINPLMRIRDGKNSDSGSGIIIPDPKHWVLPELSYIYSYHTCFDFSDAADLGFKRFILMFSMN